MQDHLARAVRIKRSLQDKPGVSPQEIMMTLGLDRAEYDVVAKAVREAMAESAAEVADYWAGSERALNCIVGQMMKKTCKEADAGEVHKLAKERWIGSSRYPS